MATRAAPTGRTRDRTRPKLLNVRKVLAKAPSAHDPKQTFGRLSPVRIRLGINCPFRTTLTPNSIFSDADMPPAVAAATIQLWQSGMLSKRTAHRKAREGAPTNPDRDFDAEQGEIEDGPIWEQP